MSYTRRLFILVMLLPFCSYAGNEIDYAVKNINPELLVGANIVVRENTTEIRIVSPDDVVIKHHYALTILNEAGNKYANFSTNFSQLKKINAIYGTVYDADGQIVTNIRTSNFTDYPMFKENYQFMDEKLKRYNVTYRTYPYTVEYTVELEHDHTFFIQDWNPQVDGHSAVEHAQCTVYVPVSANLKFRQFHISDQPQIIKGEDKSYKWVLSAIPAQKHEQFLAKDEFELPTILFALDSFRLDDFEGSTGSWLSFGKFIYDINKGRDSIPAEIKTRILKQVNGVTTEREKINILYSSMQHHMRYVAVEYGIGGWQTLTSSYVDKNQYGDCKALSNYMMSTLSVVGIIAYPVIIKAGRDNNNSPYTDFVSSQFNHEILCIPLSKDTIWLECTSSDLNSGYLSDFTQNRTGLMITPQGGYLVHTPKYDTAVNWAIHHADISIASGGLSVTMRNTYNGEPAVNLYRNLNEENAHDKDEYIHSKFNLPSYEVNNYEYNRNEQAPVMSVSENAGIMVNGLFTQTGSRSFINLDVYPPAYSIPAQSGERKNEFFLPQSSARLDTFEFKIPSGTEAEFIPKPVNLQYPFGDFSCTITKKDNKLIFTRRLALVGGTYEAAQFTNFVKLMEMVNNESHKKVVLKNKL